MTAIYSLKDPRDGTVRYIGQTRRGLAARLKQHLVWARKYPGSSVEKGTWLRELVAAGLSPVVELITEVPDDQADDVEISYIRHFEQFAPITNVDHSTRKAVERRAKKAAKPKTDWLQVEIDAELKNRFKVATIMRGSNMTVVLTKLLELYNAGQLDDALEAEKRAAARGCGGIEVLTP